jgi:predicted nucleotidyltransferase
MAVINDLIQKRAREAVKIVARQAHVRAAYLFGSHVEGTADRFSDIDIAAFVEGTEQWDIRRRARAAVEAQKQVGSDIEIHLFPAELLDNPPAASFAAYIQAHGVPVEI